MIVILSYNGIDRRDLEEDELNDKVKALMDEFDLKKETIRYEQIKSFADFIALSMSMPLPEELKEDIIKTLVEKAREKEE